MRSTRSGTAIGILLAAVAIPSQPAEAAGAEPTGLVTGTVFLDANRDNELDDGEHVLPGEHLTLRDGSGSYVRSTSTDGIGHYSFTVPLGEYHLDVSGSRYGGASRDVRLTREGEQVGADFAKVGAPVAGQLWQESNANAVRDEHDVPVAGRTIRIVGVNYHRRTTTTADGRFRFPDVPAGSYEVHVPADGAESFTTPLAGDDPTVDSDVTESFRGNGKILTRVTKAGDGELVSDTHLGAGFEVAG